VPCVDDGTATIAESLTALAGLYQEGVRTVVTTPHLLIPHLESHAAISRELDVHRRAFDRLAEAVAGREDLPALALGQEIYAPDASAARRVARRTDIGLNGRFLLVEFGFELQGSHTDVISEVLDAGRQIVIAHPERYAYLPGHDPLELMRRWQELGALLQVNVGSLNGYYRNSSPGSDTLAWQMVGQRPSWPASLRRFTPRGAGNADRPRRAGARYTGDGGDSGADRAERPGRFTSPGVGWWFQSPATAVRSDRQRWRHPLLLRNRPAP